MIIKTVISLLKIEKKNIFEYFQIKRKTLNIRLKYLRNKKEDSDSEKEQDELEQIVEEELEDIQEEEEKEQ